MDSRLSGTAEIITKLHVDWGHASAHQSERLLVDSTRELCGLGSYVDEGLEQCEICCVLDKAPRVPDWLRVDCFSLQWEIAIGSACSG